MHYLKKNYRALPHTCIPIITNIFYCINRKIPRMDLPLSHINSSFCSFLSKFIHLIFFVYSFTYACFRDIVYFYYHRLLTFQIITKCILFFYSPFYLSLNLSTFLSLFPILLTFECIFPFVHNRYIHKNFQFLLIAFLYIFLVMFSYRSPYFICHSFFILLSLPSLSLNVLSSKITVLVLFFLLGIINSL